MSLEILEQNITGKRKLSDICEDGLFISNDYIAVIDGVTSKGEKRYTSDNLTSGAYAKTVLISSLSLMPPELDGPSAITYLNNSLRDASEEYLSMMESFPEEKLQAVIIIYSIFRKEIWSFGDCQCLINGILYKNEKEIDFLLSEIRSMYNKIALRLGYSAEDIQKEDPGRSCILPLLKKQLLFANSNADLGYDVLNGFEIHPEHTKIYPISTPSVVVLASDGYPILKDSLVETESCLMELLKKDPLCLDELRGTKGILPGNNSFDDRTYVKFFVR